MVSFLEALGLLGHGDLLIRAEGLGFLISFEKKGENIEE